MQDDAPIQIKVEPKQARMLTFTVGDDHYRFRVPKSHSLMRAVRGMQADGSGTAEIAMYHHIEDWLLDACEDGDKLLERLTDPDDPIDTEHVVEIFQAVVKAASSRPSGSRRSA